MQLLPGSLLRVLFPRLSIAGSAAAGAMATEAALALAAILAPLITCGILLSDAFFRLWLGASFAQAAWGVPEILLAGVWINCLAWVPVTLLQAQGRPGLVARLHVIELAPFVALVWVGVQFGGLVGAAIATSLRVAVDGVVLFWVSGLAVPMARRLVWPTLLVAGAVVVSLGLPRLSVMQLGLGGADRGRIDRVVGAPGVLRRRGRGVAAGPRPGVAARPGATRAQHGRTAGTVEARGDAA